MFLTVVIPVYNAEKYIENCVKSLVALPSFLGINADQVEVILVDDGSKDKSGDICDALSREENPFDVKVLHQKNQGVSVARNEGLKIAIGEWVWFIDADDYVEVSCEKNSCSCACEEKFAVTGFVWEENGKASAFGASNGEIPYNLWRCWFRRDLIQKYGISFTKGRKYAEDQEFILKYLICVGNTESLPLSNLHYYYTMRPGSAMTRSGIKGKQAKDLFSVLLTLFFVGMKKGTWKKKWYWKEMKRMTKTLIVVLSR